MYFLLITTISSLILFLYIYLTWNFKYWKIRGVLGPVPTILVGSFPGSFRQKINLIYEIDQIYKEYRGKVPFVGVFSTRQPRLLILDPQVNKNILITNFKNFNANEFSDTTDPKVDPLLGKNPFSLSGELWREKRAEITPAFTALRIKAMYPLIENVCDKMIKFVNHKIDNKKYSSHKTPFEAKELAAKFAIDVVSCSIYGIDSKAFAGDKCEIRDVGGEILKPSAKILIYFTICALFPFVKIFWKMPFVSKNVEKYFTTLLTDAIEMRKQLSIERNDYLNYLLELQRKKNLSHLDMAAHAISFFLDGFETSSALIGHIFYLIAMHEDKQIKLRTAINDMIAKDGELTFDNIQDIEYLDQVFNETLRMYPPGGFLTRRCTTSTHLIDWKDKKLSIEKGMIVMTPLWSLHNDPEYYTNPEQFQPERFDLENGGVKKFKDMCVFIPWGEGPRQCLGMRFATIQSKACVAAIVRNFNISLNEKTKSPYILEPTNFISYPIGGIWINLNKLTK